MMDLTQGEWVVHVLRHPFAGFADLRWKRGGSLKLAAGIVLLLFLAMLASARLTGFQFGTLPDKTFSILPYLMRSVLMFAMWTVGNWAISTWLDGEGSLRNICIYSAYALIPYIAQAFLCVLLSHVLTQEEAVFAAVVHGIGLLWSALLLFMAMKTVHQYSVPKTLGAIALTILSMAAMLFLLVLLLSLFQTVAVFCHSIYTEIVYRIRV